MRSDAGFYILDENRQPKAATIEEFARWCATRDRHVKEIAFGHEAIGTITVSTIFSGLDYRVRCAGPPILYETMVFGGPHDGYQERCATWDQAEAMHQRIVDMVKKELQAAIKCALGRSESSRLRKRNHDLRGQDEGFYGSDADRD